MTQETTDETTDPADDGTPRVSVVVPCFNAREYLRECFDSILAQSFPSWEAVLVDDGSTDGGNAIMEEYAKRDARFRVIRKENSGVTASRKRGAEIARAEWIFFMDADDKIFPDALGTLLRAADAMSDALPRIAGTGGGIDAVFGIHVPDPDGAHPMRNRSEFLRERADVAVFHREAYAVEIANPDTWLFVGALHGGLLRKSLLLSSGALEIPPWIRKGEDRLGLYRYSLRMRNAVKIFRKVYFYRDTPGSVCKTEVMSAECRCRMIMLVVELVKNGLPAGALAEELRFHDFGFHWLKKFGGVPALMRETASALKACSDALSPEMKAVCGAFLLTGAKRMLFFFLFRNFSRLRRAARRCGNALFNSEPQ